MHEIRSSRHQSKRFLAGLRTRSRVLWDGLFRNVRSSLTLSVSFESSLALVCLYGVLGYAAASVIGGPHVQ